MTAKEPVTLLFVDDEADTADSLAELFHAHDPTTRVLVAHSTAEAERVVRAKRVDVIVSDLRMPGGDGAQLLEKVLQIRPQICRVLMTAYPDPAVLARAINAARVDWLLLKPLEPDETMRVLGELVQQRRTVADRAA